MAIQPLAILPISRDTLDLVPRTMSDEQMRRFEGYAAEIFSVLGLDLDTPATTDTPRRFIRALFDATVGYDGDAKLVTVFDTECRPGPDCRLSQVVEAPSSSTPSVSITPCHSMDARTSGTSPATTSSASPN
jgi:hypothetical protein